MSFLGKIFGKKSENPNTVTVKTSTVKQEQPPKFSVGKLPEQLTEDTCDFKLKIEEPKEKKDFIEHALDALDFKEHGEGPTRPSVIKFSDNFNPLAKLTLNQPHALDNGTKILMQKNEKGLIFKITGPVNNELLEELYDFKYGKLNQKLSGIENIIQTKVVGNSLKIEGINAHYINTLGERVGKTMDIRDCGASCVADFLASILKKVR